MGGQVTNQGVVVAQEAVNPNQVLERVALFDEDGTPIDLGAIPALDGDEILLTGYEAGTAAAVGATDTINEGLAKVEAVASSAATGGAAYSAKTVGTAIGTAAKTTTSAEPAANTIVALKFTNGNSAETPTVAFNGGTARALKLGGTASAAAKFTLAANGVALFWFDGTILHQIGVYS